ncbi:MAG: hypothetical protein FJX74_07200 [Armatimonadetes bacterium]|nr:hypothetical protein [Armatimonadota bacterium]
MQRLGPRHMFVVVALVTTSAAVSSQPAVDRVDPTAVATAYVQACRDGDLETALSLLQPDERLEAELRDMVGSFSEEGGPGRKEMTLGDFAMELQFMPMAFAVDRVLLSSQAEGDRAQVAFRTTWPAEQQIVLTRAEDGTWSIDLLASLRATNSQGVSWLAEEMHLDEAAIEGPPQATVAMPGEVAPGALEAYQSMDVLGRLVEALGDYARDHDGCLPPAETWVDELELYTLDRSAFRSPGAPDLAYGFAMNPAAGGRKLDDAEAGAEEEFLVLFEWPGGERNATATPEQLAEAGSFWPDGSVAFLSSWRLAGALPKGMTLEEARAGLGEGPGVEFAEGEEAQMHAYICEANLEILARAARRYAREHGGRLPAAESWQDDLAPYILLDREQDPWGGGDPAEPEPYHCPAAPDIGFGYAINAAIAGKSALDLTDQDTLVLFFESALDVPNAAGDPETDQCNPPRHRMPWGDEHNQIAFLTGETSRSGGADGPGTEPEAPMADE